MKKTRIMSLTAAILLIFALFAGAAEYTAAEGTAQTGNDGIDYDFTDLIVNGKVDGGEDGGYYINLTEETFTLPPEYKIAAYSVDGGKKWMSGSKAFAKGFPSSFFSKDFTLILTDKYDVKTKKPSEDAAIVRFPKIKKRPKRETYVVNYLIGADPSGATAGTWVLTVKNGKTSVKDGIEIAAADSSGKAPDQNGYGRFYGANESANGISIKELPSNNKPVKNYYFIRTAPVDNGDGTYTAAGAARKITANGQSKAPSYKADSKKEIIKYNANTYISKNNEIEYKAVKGEISVSAYNGDVYLWSAAKATAPASAIQKITVTSTAAGISSVSSAVAQMPVNASAFTMPGRIGILFSDGESEGNDIPDNAVHIGTAEELAPIGGEESAGKYYVLDNDINLGGREWTPIDNFLGTFDGRGYTISNLFVLAESSRQYAGLFGEIPPGGFTIKNVTVNMDPQGIYSSYGSLVCGIILGADVFPLTKEETLDLSDKIHIDGSTDVTWSSINPEVAVVNNGIITAKNSGTAIIVLTITEDAETEVKTASCSIIITVAPVAVTGVSLNKDNTTIAVGKTETLIATVEPSEAANKKIAWSSGNEAVAIVDANGIVTAVSAGTVTITVTTEDGNKTAFCTVTVTVPVSSVSLDKSSAIIKVGGSETLAATIMPSNATNKKIAWSSGNEAVATVNANGIVTAISAGTAVITVTTEDGNKTAVCTVTVTVPVASVDLDKYSITIEIGGADTVTATITPSDATNKNVIWTSGNTSVASVTNDGMVTGLKAGVAIITVTTEDGNKTAECSVAVTPVSVTGVILNKTSATIEVGKSETLVATVEPSAAENKAVTWTSGNPNVATVDSGGLVKAISAGTAVITVTTADGSKTAACAVTVSPSAIPVSGITLNKTSITIVKGESSKLTATVAPSDAANKNVAWSSSDSYIAYVDQYGNVTARNTGTCVITARAGEKNAFCTVTVTSGNGNSSSSVTGISLDESSVTVKIGETKKLTASITPSSAAGANVTWTSSDSRIATVNGNGVITAVSAGIAVITASAGGKTAICTVNSVTELKISVTYVSLNKSSLILTEGDTEELKATLSPYNATVTGVSWSSSNLKVASVDSSGRVKAEAAGTAVITVSTLDGGKVSTCSVVVTAATKATGVILNKSSLTLEPGKSETLTATVSPYNASNKKVIWTSGDQRVATVDTNGKVTAKAGGTAAITVKTSDGGYTAVCRLIVEAPEVEYTVTLTKTAGGTASTSNTSARAGTKVALTAAADSGYYFAGWETSPSSVSIKDGGFTMPASNVTVKPVFKAVLLVDNYIDAANIKASDAAYKITFTPEETKNGILVINIPSFAFSELAKKNPKLIIEFETPYGTYKLPVNFASLIPDLTRILEKNGVKEENVGFNIILTDKAPDKTLREAFAVDMPKGTLMSAVDFAVEIVRMDGGKPGRAIGTAGSFSEQIERMIQVSNTRKQMPANSGIFKYNETSKKFEFVPHTTELTDDGLYAVIKSSTNSVYIAAENPVEFNDVKTEKWYAEYVLKAASKRLVQGVGDGLYQPERNVTRAEFIQLIANALQLPDAMSDTGLYSDVKSGAWYYTAVMRANSAGMLDKFNGGNFSPDKAITREEIAVILAAALKYERFTLKGQAVNLADIFADYGNCTADYTPDISTVYRAGIMQGVGGGLFDPKGTTTRAQAATVQIRLLQLLEFID